MKNVIYVKNCFTEHISSMLGKIIVLAEWEDFYEDEENYNFSIVFSTSTNFVILGSISVDRNTLIIKSIKFDDYCVSKHFSSFDYTSICKNWIGKVFE